MFEASFLGTLIERGYRIIFTRACIVGDVWLPWFDQVGTLSVLTRSANHSDFEASRRAEQRRGFAQKSVGATTAAKPQRPHTVGVDFERPVASIKQAVSYMDGPRFYISGRGSLVATRGALLTRVANNPSEAASQPASAK